MNNPKFKDVEVGTQLPELALRPLSRTTLALYAGGSGDHVPLHIDTDYARKAGMPDVFGHGMLTAAWLGRMLTGWVSQDRVRKLDVRFVGITHLYNQVSCTGQVVEKLEQNGEQCVRVAIQATNQYGDKKVVGEALVALA
ncbi:Acyl dehydratase [Collimonas sp. OK307]|uniref:MaoC family dehydratase n=1 Tax=Collimonas sp. OK307 TaxID=1801620 RepID=UPI0008E5F880|nr:MaoC family dehydratase [Collimonas sp. OK307]SFI00267.1 Acyl dehydratase [Collimonas sp. OK307]